MDRTSSQPPRGKTDEELDRDWKPSGRRPQSTIARSFSQELMDIFRIENSVADLDEKVDRRKQEINHQNSELEALEARIKEMEARLKNPTAAPAAVPAPSSSSAAAAQQPQYAPHQSHSPTSASSPRPARVPVGGAFPDRTAEHREQPREQHHHRREQQHRDRDRDREHEAYYAAAREQQHSSHGGHGGHHRPAPLGSTPKPPSSRGSRPGTARAAGQQGVGGALPPTPVASEDGDDYEVV